MGDTPPSEATEPDVLLPQPGKRSECDVHAPSVPHGVYGPLQEANYSYGRSIKRATRSSERNCLMPSKCPPRLARNVKQNSDRGGYAEWHLYSLRVLNAQIGPR
jgi:hypothetical protein